jgi:hypothetical protein
VARFSASHAVALAANASTSVSSVVRTFERVG